MHDFFRNILLGIFLVDARITSGLKPAFRRLGGGGGDPLCKIGKRSLEGRRSRDWRHSDIQVSKAIDEGE